MMRPMKTLQVAYTSGLYNVVEQLLLLIDFELKDGNQPLLRRQYSVSRLTTGLAAKRPRHYLHVPMFASLNSPPSQPVKPKSDTAIHW